MWASTVLRAIHSPGRASRAPHVGKHRFRLQLFKRSWQVRGESRRAESHKIDDINYGQEWPTSSSNSIH